METTKDYDKFIMVDYNREKVNKRHVQQVKNSIAERGYLVTHPIIVNENFEIIDGQHRFLACKDLGIPISYEVLDDDKDLMLILNNTQKNWGIIDYINYFAIKKQNKNYIRLLEACKQSNLAPTLALAVAEGRMTSGTDSVKIKAGELKFTEADINRVVSFSENLKQVATNIRQTLNKRMSDALIALSRKEEFKWSTMLHKTHKYSTKAYPCVSKEDYIIMLREVYNYNCKSSDNRLK